MNKNVQQQAGDEHRLKTVSDPDAREWIVEYQPYQATTGAWKLPSVFRQREGRKEYKKAVASADSRASMNDGKREALEREKRQIQREKRRIERQLADLDEADRVERDRQLEKEGAV